MWRIRATWRRDGGKPCAARPSFTSSASVNGSSSLAFRTHVRNAGDGQKACRRADCCEGNRSAKSRGTTRGPADTVFLHVFAKFRRDPLSDPPELHGRMLPHATHGPMATCSGVQIGTSPITSERDGQMVSEAQSGFRTRKCVLPELKCHESAVRHVAARAAANPALAPTRPAIGRRPRPAAGAT